MDKLQWGNRKRLRCVKVKENKQAHPPPPPPPLQSPPRLSRDLGMNRSSLNENQKMLASSSPEKEDRYYTTRGSTGLDENNKFFMEAREDNNRGGGVVWPKLYVTLSCKEKEEDFMAMKGCKLPHRPKKRAKLIQRTLLSVSPGAWLSDMCQERYEVREKKASKKMQRPRGLKAMGSMESDSE